MFGVDETIALGSVYGFGSIAVTTFGYLDKQKVGIIKELDNRKPQVHTFLDDLVASIAASAAARLAHRIRDKEQNRRMEEIKKNAKTRSLLAKSILPSRSKREYGTIYMRSASREA